MLSRPAGFELYAPVAHDHADAVLLFVRDREELATLGGRLSQAAREDRLAWLAHPKAGQLETDLNRDILLEETKPDGVRPV